MSSEQTDLTDAIRSAATGPKSVKTEAGEVAYRDISEMTEADSYLKKQKTGKNPLSCLQCFHASPNRTHQ